MLDLENAEIQEDGTVKGLLENIETLKGAEDSKFLFETDEAQNSQALSRCKEEMVFLYPPLLQKHLMMIFVQ